MSAQKPTVLLPLLYGLTVRNYLRTEFIDEMIAGGAHVVALIPNPELDGLREEFEPKGVQLEPYPLYKPTFLEKRLRDLIGAQFQKKYPLNALAKKELDMKHLSYWRWVFNYVLAQPLMPTSQDTVLDRWYRNLHRTDIVDGLWDRVKPDLLLSTHSFFWEELPFLKKAKLTGTPIGGLLHSWDNLTTKFKLPYEFDRFMVWNDIMKGEMGRYYPGWEQKCDVVGIPQYDDFYRIDELGQDRKTFLTSMGLDPDLKLIIYTANPDRVLVPSTTHADVRVILEAIRDNAFGGPVNVLVRFHNMGNLEPVKPLMAENFPNVVYEQPGRLSEATKDNYNPSREDMIHFADSLRHADCAVNTFSTITADATFFDTPMINIAGDFTPEKTRDAYLEQFYTWEHYDALHETGCFDTVNTPGDLVAKIKICLDDPSYRREGRKAFHELFGGPCDGQAARRVARVALDMLGLR